MTQAKRLSRRTFLRAAGASIALPALEAMNPAPALAGSISNAMRPHPLRMAVCYIPNGVILPKWKIKKEGKLDKLSPALQALEPYKNDFQMLGNLCNHMANRNKLRKNHNIQVPAQGAHPRSSATFLSGEIAERSGPKLKVGQSIDQIAADKIGGLTRLPSLELSCDRRRKTGPGENGYSEAYRYNISWRSASTPMPAENNPRLAFERLFGSGNAKADAKNRGIRELYNKSILDFVMADARDLQRSLGVTDRRKLDEYLTSVREIERRVEAAGKFSVKRPNYKKPESGIPDTFEEYIRLMFDILRLAFQTDTTRIATFVLNHESSQHVFKNLGVTDGHHTLSHHQNDKKKIYKIEKIDKFYSEQFAYFLKEMKQVQEGDGTLLDNSMILYGSAVSDANLHSNDDLPIILAGGGAGTLKPGRNVIHQKDTPITNLYISMLDRMGVRTRRIGDSTGALKNI